MLRHYDRQGHPISQLRWAQLRDGHFRVDKTCLPNGIMVSTVWLGIDHSITDLRKYGIWN